MAPRSVAQRSALPLAVPEARGGQRRREDESRSPRSSTAHYLGLQLWARQHARHYEIFERTLTVATRRRTPKGARGGPHRAPVVRVVSPSDAGPSIHVVPEFKYSSPSDHEEMAHSWRRQSPGKTEVMRVRKLLWVL
ncbi:hypothetical protein HPB47_024729 [Ixodes persulcatus]|uniref:Uncharacterized protein n=1 Tax=Ixodes persulcatus TaxID=34615 RepID=A0AC60Q3G6_IXOPE|nr:hypothetical protein HPB47_024729 [Ixodes persulcatus]